MKQKVESNLGRTVDIEFDVKGFRVKQTGIIETVNDTFFIIRNCSSFHIRIEDLKKIERV